MWAVISLSEPPCKSTGNSVYYLADHVLCVYSIFANSMLHFLSSWDMGIFFFFFSEHLLWATFRGNTNTGFHLFLGLQIRPRFCGHHQTATVKLKANCEHRSFSNLPPCRLHTNWGHIKQASVLQEIIKMGIMIARTVHFHLSLIVCPNL